MGFRKSIFTQVTIITILLCPPQLASGANLLGGSVEFHGIITNGTLSISKSRLLKIIEKHDELIDQGGTWLDEEILLNKVRQGSDVSHPNLSISIVKTGFDGSKFNVIMNHQ